MKESVTRRGFRLGEFEDVYGAKCSIQKSSLAEEDCIWIGVDTDLNGEPVEYGRMHLNQEQVKDLLPKLAYFAEAGELPQISHSTGEDDTYKQKTPKESITEQLERLGLQEEFNEDLKNLREKYRKKGLNN